MVPTGTNLLRLVQHVASVEFGYFGETFGRAHDEPLPWFEPGSGRVCLDRVQVPDRVPVVVPLLVQRRGIGSYGWSRRIHRPSRVRMSQRPNHQSGSGYSCQVGPWPVRQYEHNSWSVCRTGIIPTLPRGSGRPQREHGIAASA